MEQSAQKARRMGHPQVRVLGGVGVGIQGSHATGRVGHPAFVIFSAPEEPDMELVPAFELRSSAALAEELPT
jgi:hypothetical protein